VTKNILIAPNSFKECADSVEIAELINKTLSENNSIKTIVKPLSDGGDGFLKVIQSLYSVTPIVYSVYDNNNNLTKDIIVLFDKTNKNVYIESAALFGINVVPKVNRKPLKLNTEILGDVLLNLAADVKSNKYEIDEVVIGIGGTATIDFALGALSKLGFKFYDLLENPVEPHPLYFITINKIENRIKQIPFLVKCIIDVDTELIDDPGAIEIYGKQKGASESDLKIIKSGIKNILEIISAENKLNIPQKLNGAGGGLASGLNIFLDAEIIRAEDFIKDDILKDINLNEIDAVITGEGSFDYQSFEGKGSGIILKLFAEKNIQIFLINGITTLPQNIKLPENVSIINLIDLFNSKEESIKNYRAGIMKATQIILNNLNK
jgi:glycerate kinase